MDFGLQTFTIRKAQKKSIEQAYLPLIRMGIKKFEIARIDFNASNAQTIKALVDKYGIEVCSIQVKPKYVFSNVSDLVSFCKTVGCQTIVISMLPFKCILGNDKRFYDFIATLDAQYEIYEKHGITLAYHHHNWEYVRTESGACRMDELLSKTKKIKFVHDTYWTAKSGIDPKVQIERFGSRLIGVHLRDLSLHKRGINVLSSDCAIGDGVLDFEGIVAAAIGKGAEYMVIEQKTEEPYRDIEKSYKKLKLLPME